MSIDKLTENFFRQNPRQSGKICGYDLVKPYGKGFIRGKILETGVFYGQSKRRQSGLELEAGRIYIPTFKGGRHVLAINTLNEKEPAVITIRKLEMQDGEILKSHGIVERYYLSPNNTNESICEDKIWIEKKDISGYENVFIPHEKKTRYDNLDGIYVLRKK